MEQISRFSLQAKSFTLACKSEQRPVEAGMKIASGAVYNTVLMFMLREADGIFKRMLGLDKIELGKAKGKARELTAEDVAGVTSTTKKLLRWTVFGRVREVCAEVDCFGECAGHEALLYTYAYTSANPQGAFSQFSIHKQVVESEAPDRTQTWQHAACPVGPPIKSYLGNTLHALAAMTNAPPWPSHIAPVAQSGPPDQVLLRQHAACPGRHDRCTPHGLHTATHPRKRSSDDAAAAAQVR
eukprot:1161224-Pelagomonas_calceolata.AAC.12